MVILELIITIKLYKVELNCDSQESIEEEQRKTEQLKKCWHLVFFCLVFAVVLEQILRQVLQWNSGETNFVFMIELLVISFFMTLSTVLLIKMINKVFGSEFVDEKL